MKAPPCFLVPVAACLLGATPALSAPVIVHEWGTFTCLQDEEGHAIGGINVDDEPVPYFVEQYANRIVASQYSRDQGNFGLPPYHADGGKGWTVGDPSVTMRLETPVLYLYPPKGEAPASVPPLDVHVDFHGGVLSQFYPHAQTNGALLNVDNPYLDGKPITEAMTTGLTWKGVTMGASGQAVESSDKDLLETPWRRGEVVASGDKVWTTPREVGAPLLQVHFTSPDYGHPGQVHRCMETEHFLFYRGVGHLDSPLQVTRDAWSQGERGTLFVRPGATYTEGWGVDIRADGTCAFWNVASVGEAAGKRSHPMPGFSPKFDHSDFSSANLARLKASMQDALVKEGLYPDEASAMLRTWELSYFKSPGLRFFYIVPRAWVDRVLPLKITGAPVRLTRVMIGRIELVTDAQKAALARLAAGPCPDLAAVRKAAGEALEKKTMSKESVDAFYSGEKPLAEWGIPLPPLVRDYLSLGRFRDALIVHEARRHPTPALTRFIAENKLKPLEPISP